MFCFSRSAPVSSGPAVFISTPATGCEAAMTFELIFGAAISIGMLIYLVFALLRPEKF
jgi:K+-transporting ATPase KdpF subunit